MKTFRILYAGAVFAAAMSMPWAAWASHGKAGLWEVTVQSSMGAMQHMPDLSQMPPQVRARMQAMGMQMTANGVVMTIRHCMTADEVKLDKPNMSHNRNCKAANVTRSGDSFSADLVCTGRMTGTGHVQFSFDSPEHYAGSETMNGTVEGRPVSNATKIDAHWISPDCGKTH